MGKSPAPKSAPTPTAKTPTPVASAPELFMSFERDQGSTFMDSTVLGFVMSRELPTAPPQEPAETPWWAKGVREFLPKSNKAAPGVGAVDNYLNMVMDPITWAKAGHRLCTATKSGFSSTVGQDTDTDFHRDHLGREQRVRTWLNYVAVGHDGKAGGLETKALDLRAQATKLETTVVRLNGVNAGQEAMRRTSRKPFSWARSKHSLPTCVPRVLSGRHR